MDAAVAYATPGGVNKLREAFDVVSMTKWDEIAKRWLLSIDYCRTNPYAIEMLTRGGEVRVHDGSNVVTRTLCNPQLPFHPKAFIFRNGTDHVGIIQGSGNLSRNGMTQGHEVGAFVTSATANAQVSQNFTSESAKMQAWFDHLWSIASPATGIIDRYKEVYKSKAHVKNPTPTDDDETPPGRSYTKTRRDGSTRNVYVSSPDPVMVRKLRTADNFWIVAGNSGNRPGRPGTQINMTPYTRVFFEFQAECKDINQEIGKVIIVYNGTRHADIPLRFSDNCMDVITLPLPDAIGVGHYELKPIRFQRMGGSTFTMTIGTPRDLAKWTDVSKASESFFTMKGATTFDGQRVKRTWGVF